MSQKVLYLEEKQGPWTLRDRPIPNPKPGQVLVRVEAAALNPADWKTQKWGGMLTEYPAIMGLDGAGIVKAVGEGVNEPKEGDRVIFPADYGVYDSCAFQQFSVVEAKFAAKVPADISLDQAVSVPLCLLTAAFGLYLPRNYDRGGAGLEAPWSKDGKGKYAGQPILVIGGSSSVGMYVIQLAKLSGFSPIIVTASPHNEALLKSLGATHVVDRNVPLAEAVRAITAKPIGVVYDAISVKETLQAGWNLLSPDGALASVTLPPILDLPAEGDARSVSHVIAIATHPDQRCVSEPLFEHLPQLLADKAIVPNPTQVVSGGLGGIPAALKPLEENKVSAKKIVVKPQATA